MPDGLHMTEGRISSARLAGMGAWGLRMCRRGAQWYAVVRVCFFVRVRACVRAVVGHPIFTASGLRYCERDVGQSEGAPRSCCSLMPQREGRKSLGF